MKMNPVMNNSIICPDCFRVCSFVDELYPAICKHCERIIYQSEYIYARKHEIQIEIMRQFSTLRGIRLWKTKNAIATNGDKLARYGISGQGQISGIGKGGIRIEIQILDYKSQQTRRMKKFQRTIERFKGKYILARSPKCVEEGLKGIINE